MRWVAKSFRFALGALLAAALALGPVVAFAAAQPMHHGEPMAADDGVPCDMPCEGCGDGIPKWSCAIACLGLIAAMPPCAIVATPGVRAIRVEAQSRITLAGRDREPDKPPPRLALA